MRTPINLAPEGQQALARCTVLSAVILFWTVACEPVPSDFQSLANEV